LEVLAHYHVNSDRADKVVQFEYREITSTTELKIAARQHGALFGVPRKIDEGCSSWFDLAFASSGLRMVLLAIIFIQ
jgi:hypothetical protein